MLIFCNSFAGAPHNRLKEAKDMGQIGTKVRNNFARPVERRVLVSTRKTVPEPFSGRPPASLN
jgi:hypothetical protein